MPQCLSANISTICSWNQNYLITTELPCNAGRGRDAWKADESDPRWASETMVFKDSSGAYEGPMLLKSWLQKSSIMMRPHIQVMMNDWRSISMIFQQRFFRRSLTVMKNRMVKIPMIMMLIRIEMLHLLMSLKFSMIPWTSTNNLMKAKLQLFLMILLCRLLRLRWTHSNVLTVQRGRPKSQILSLHPL